MVNDSSLRGSAPQLAFDLDTQTGVAHLLASVRVSDIGSEKKNELRDLIFLYANGGKDQSVRNTLEQKIHSYGLVPAVAVVKQGERNSPGITKTIYPFGTSRPAPSFPVSGNSSTFKLQVPTPVPKPISNTEIVREVPPVPTPVKVAPIVESVAAPAPAVEVKSVTAPPPENIPVQQQAAPYDSSQSLERIREIKSLVNEKVGNPVNLVDINNEVGREYMGALLDAMKKLNNGSSAASAMKRLEEAYQKVERTLAEHENHKTEVNLPTPVAALQTEVPVEVPKPVVPSPQPITVPVPATESLVAPVPKPVAPVAEEIGPVKSDNSNIVSTQPHGTTRSVVSSQSVNVSPAPVKETVPENRTAWEAGGEAPSEKKSEMSPTSPNHLVTSLAQSKSRLRTPQDLPRSSDIETSSMSGDPLFTNEVDEGLQQLLSEWTLFKKSGLFGTGPNGRQHPLFLKVAGLQIPLLLAGRFEGATQEVKQSITDYMNGWRYEQGIIYVPGETFEHYLRRVIRHILDLQKKAVNR